MHFGAILPHTLLYGGVKRYLELGNALIAKRHHFTIYTPEGLVPGWFAFNGSIELLSRISGAQFDVLFTSEEVFLPELLSAKASRRIFYVISKNKALRSIARHKNIELFANSSTTYERVLRIAHRKAFKAYGGVNTALFRPVSIDRKGSDFRVLTYGRLSAAMKGTELVVKACERLFKKGLPVKLVLFDAPVNEKARQMVRDFECGCPFEYVLDHPVDKNAELFCSADIFVSAERKGGWANTAAEAMACGVPVIASAVGTRDFLIHNKTGLVVRRNSFLIARAIKRVMDDSGIREKMVRGGLTQVRQFSWERLADAIVGHVQGAQP